MRPTKSLPTQDEIDAIFASDSAAEVFSWLDSLHRGEKLTENDLLDLLEQALTIFEQEETLLHLDAPITIAGDIHGQFWDLLELFKTGGPLPETKYLFLGDIVDRGYYSIECFSLLLALKVSYPDRIFLLRGNHESSSVSQVYGFYDECNRKYGDATVWRACLDVFNVLPIAAVVGESIFCVHGGLSPDASALDVIADTPRMKELSSSGIISDLLWSDPDDLVSEWEQSPRGSGWLFGSEPTGLFLHENDLTLIARAHQLVSEGYKYWFNSSLITVWSAPNYCNKCGNSASVLKVDPNLHLSLTTFEASHKMFQKQETQPKMQLNYFL